MKETIERAAFAVARFANAASANPGQDCFGMAGLLWRLLQSLDVPAQYRAGAVSWRVGCGANDVIGHAPQYAIPGQTGIAGHAWLTVELDGLEWIVDCTTGQLPKKAAILDSLDNGSTTVLWDPTVLMAPAADSKANLGSVDDGNLGDFCYIADQKLSELVGNIVISNVDSEDLAIVQFIYKNPSIIISTP